MPDRQVETIAFVLAGLPPEVQQRLIVDAFNAASPSVPT